jgi:hypothetical protein
MGRGGEKTKTQRKKEGAQNSKVIHHSCNTIRNPIIKINGTIISESSDATNRNADRHNRNVEGTFKIGSSSGSIPSSRITGIRRDNVNVQTKRKGNRMDIGHYKRFNNVYHRNSIDFFTLLRTELDSRRIRCIPKAILKFFKKITIPFATVSTLFLTTGFAHAQSLKEKFLENGDVTKGRFSSSFMGNQTLTDQLIQSTEAFIDVINFFKHFPEHLKTLSVDLFTKLFELLMFVGLQTPTMIFNGSYVNQIVPLFSLISISIVCLLSGYEAIMMMLKKKHTDIRTMLARFPKAVTLAGFAPFLFQQGFKYINRITDGIVGLASGVLNKGFIEDYVGVGFVDILGLLAFDIALIFLIVPIVLENAKRWWDLFCLCMISPLALTAGIFDRHRHLYNQWWNAIKQKSTIQLVYATFISLLGIFIYSTRFISGEYWGVKIIILIGALARLADPPNIIKSYLRGESNTENTFEKVYKRKIPKLNKTDFWLSGYKSQNKLKLEKEKLRRKHGRRFVDDLLAKDKKK